MPLSPREWDHLVHIFDVVRRAFRLLRRHHQTTHGTGGEDFLPDWQWKESRWEREITEEMERARSNWTAEQTRAVFGALEGLPGGVGEGWIMDVEHLPQAWQLDAIAHDQPLPAHPTAASAQPPHAPVPHGSYLLSLGIEPYTLHIWPLLTDIHMAFLAHIKDYFPRGEQPREQREQAQWDSRVRTIIEARWEGWGEAGRAQAEQLLRQVLQHLREDTFRVLTSADPAAQHHPHPHPHSTFPSEPSPFSAAPDPTNPWAAPGDVDVYRARLEQWEWEHQHPHLQHHQSAAQPPPSALPPPHAFGDYPHSLAKAHRRMTESQARRYGTTVKAFSAGA
ncbi:hypothetical protein JCM6882_006139 [Rhodosporidiobolus microsporus]